MLGRNTVHPGRNVQPRGESYEGREGQIIQRWGNNGGTYRGGGNIANQIGPQRDPNAMDVDRGKGGDRKCYYCRGWGHMARNCWERNKARVIETLQESAKDGGQ